MRLTRLALCPILAASLVLSGGWLAPAVWAAPPPALTAAKPAPTAAPYPATNASVKPGPSSAPNPGPSAGVKPATNASPKPVAKSPGVKIRSVKARRVKPAAKSTAKSGTNASGNAGSPPLAVRIGQAKGLTHIDFPGNAPSTARREGDDIVLTFDHAAVSPELARLQYDPIKLVKAVAVQEMGRGLQVRLTVDAGVEARLGRDDGVASVSLLTAQALDQTAQAAQALQLTTGSKDQRPEARDNPTPSDGQVKMQAEMQGPSLQLRFPWRAPLGAAVFAGAGPSGWCSTPKRSSTCRRRPAVCPNSPGSTPLKAATTPPFASSSPTPSMPAPAPRAGSGP